MAAASSCAELVMSINVPQRALAIGQVMQERYEVREVLGEGGFAEVYLARDHTLGREVAIKVLRLDILTASAAAETLARFEQEARFAAQINHHNIISVYDVGTFEDRPFIVMERLKGHDLREELHRVGPLKPHRLWPLFTQALDGLAEAHRLGIIHKDLKPANLFLVKKDDQEELRVLDFGVARAMEGGSELTTNGLILGTPKYFAPEYIKNSALSLPPRWMFTRWG
jgi:serine/threonine protein kinase